MREFMIANNRKRRYDDILRDAERKLYKRRWT
jgi:hypothetical protein